RPSCRAFSWFADGRFQANSANLNRLEAGRDQLKFTPFQKLAKRSAVRKRASSDAQLAKPTPASRRNTSHHRHHLGLAAEQQDFGLAVPIQIRRKQPALIHAPLTADGTRQRAILIHYSLTNP